MFLLPMPTTAPAPAAPRLPHRHPPPQGVVHERFRPVRLKSSWPRASWFLAGQGRWGLRECSDTPTKVRFVPLGEYITRVGPAPSDVALVTYLQRLKEQGWNVERTERKMMMCGVTGLGDTPNSLTGGALGELLDGAYGTVCVAPCAWHCVCGTLCTLLRFLNSACNNATRHVYACCIGCIGQCRHHCVPLHYIQQPQISPYREGVPPPLCVSPCRACWLVCFCRRCVRSRWRPHAVVSKQHRPTGVGAHVCECSRCWCWGLVAL